MPVKLCCVYRDLQDMDHIRNIQFFQSPRFAYSYCSDSLAHTRFAYNSFPKHIIDADDAKNTTLLVVLVPCLKKALSSIKTCEFDLMHEVFVELDIPAVPVIRKQKSLNNKL